MLSTCPIKPLPIVTYREGQEKKIHKCSTWDISTTEDKLIRQKGSAWLSSSGWAGTRGWRPKGGRSETMQQSNCVCKGPEPKHCLAHFAEQQGEAWVLGGGGRGPLVEGSQQDRPGRWHMTLYSSQELHFCCQSRGRTNFVRVSSKYFRLCRWPSLSSTLPF